MVKEVVKVVLIGVAMGAAEIVPGVSGGTIAFISGIYERLINALKAFTPNLFRVLRDQGVKGVWQAIDGQFLAVLFGTMGVTVFLFASGVRYLLDNEPVLIWSFFFGLVIASAWVVAREISRFGVDLLLAGATGLIIGLIITTMVPINLPIAPWTLFFGGALAVCAWILPGLSGSFILLILGLYTYVIDVIGRFDIFNLAVLAAGCALGLVSFAQLLSRFFKHHRDETLSVLTGFMLGSLTKLWPWKQTVSYQIRDDGSQIPVLQEPILPSVYVDITGAEAQVGMAIVTGMAGLMIVLLIDWLATRTRDVGR
ncbi:MAG: DUF368 domain-containing protein [Pseudomonadales bacterium]